MRYPLKWCLLDTREWDEYEGEPGFLLQLIYRGDGGGYVLVNHEIPIAEWLYERGRRQLMGMLRGYRERVWAALVAESSKPKQMRLLGPT